MSVLVEVCRPLDHPFHNSNHRFFKIAIAQLGIRMLYWDTLFDPYEKIQNTTDNPSSTLWVQMLNQAI